MEYPEPTGPIYHHSSTTYRSPDPGSHVKPMRPCYTSCREGFPSTEPTASNFLPLTSIPTMMYTPPPPPAVENIPVRQRRDTTGSAQSPFLRLPTEIRLQIYSLLVLPRASTDLLPSYQKVNASEQDYFDYDK